MKKVIMFFIARLTRSGVPLAQIRLAKALARRGHDVHFVIGFAQRAEKLPECCEFSIINIDQPRTFRLIPHIIVLIKSKRPDIIFSAEDHLNAIVSMSVLLSRSKAKLSVSSRVTPYDTYSNKIFSKGWILKLINPILWARADALTCVSEDMVDQYRTIFKKVNHRPVYNVVVDSDLYRKKTEEVSHPWFSNSNIPTVVSAGRLAPEKNFSDLICAMRLVNDRRDARLLILGDGPLRSELTDLIRKLNLDDKVQLAGFQSNPYKFFGKAQLFVLSSIVEGLPNVLVEAMACGCPVVAANCPTGPREVLRDGQFGELVPVRSPPAMAEAILRALDAPPDHEKLAKAVFPFTEEQVVEAHRRLLGF